MDTPHITVLENTTEHMLAKDIAEELLLQNWNVLPNAVNIFYEPRATLPWITKGARLVIVWRHYSENEPDPESAAFTYQRLQPNWRSVEPRRNIPLLS